jgi:hypothetical protein
MPLYSTLPMFTEIFVEKGWTLTFARIDQVGCQLALQVLLLQRAGWRGRAVNRAQRVMTGLAQPAMV